MINIESVKRFCNDDISLIENYDKAINDTTQTWQCHHKLGTEQKLSREELKELGLYFKRPANELIFLTVNEHMTLHNTINNPFQGRHHSDETKQKIHNTKELNGGQYGDKNPMYGKYHSEETKQKIRLKAIGRPSPRKGCKLSEETKQKVSNTIKERGTSKGERNGMYGRKGKLSPSFGTHWYNNGEISIKCVDCPEGFVKGRLYKLKK